MGRGGRTLVELTRCETESIEAKQLQAEDLKQYDALTMRSFTAIRVEKAGLRLVYVSNERMLQGLYDSASSYRVYEEAQTRFADDYAKMAREVAGEDAARDGAAAKPVEKSGKQIPYGNGNK